LTVQTLGKYVQAASVSDCMYVTGTATIGNILTRDEELEDSRRIY